MLRISEVLLAAGETVVDKKLGWGAKLSAYAEDLSQLEAGVIPVLVELDLDCEVPQSGIIVDHHGDLSQRSASILQVLDLIGQEPNRKDLLIAANDTGYIPGMLAAGATQSEVEEIRAIDRSASGEITQEMEEQAEAAIEAANAYEVAQTGEVVVIHLPHSKTATVADRLFSSWKNQFEHLLVLSEDGETNFYGDGALCQALYEKFEGWAGKPGLGKKGEHAFWGGYGPQDEVELFIKNY